jgi:pimeloyl-ACP methyl ester carboxylesterase
LLSYTTYLQPQSAQWVTFVHGAGGSSAIWYKQIKAFNKNYNVLLVDLRGHGESKSNFSSPENYTFNTIAQDVIDVLNKLNINKTHLIGISLGTIIIRQIAAINISLVSSLVMAGAIMKLNFRSQVLMKLGMFSKSVIPYLLLYKFFAYIIMPRKNHKKSRLLFIHEAKKLNQKEFIRWFKLATEVNPLLQHFREKEAPVPTLYLMGNEDAMFLPSIKKLVISHNKYASLEIVNHCGHVVNVDEPEIFNKKVLAFLHLQVNN